MVVVEKNAENRGPLLSEWGPTVTPTAWANIFFPFSIREGLKCVILWLLAEAPLTPDLPIWALLLCNIVVFEHS